MLREARSWTQEHLAERAAMQRSYLGDMELGRRNLTVRTLVKVANALALPFQSSSTGAEKAEEREHERTLMRTRR